MEKNITFFKIGILFLILGLHCQSFAQSVNTTSTISWAFNSETANQLPTYSAETDSYLKPALVTGEKSSKVIFTQFMYPVKCSAFITPNILILDSHY